MPRIMVVMAKRQNVGWEAAAGYNGGEMEEYGDRLGCMQHTQWGIKPAPWLTAEAPLGD